MQVARRELWEKHKGSNAALYGRLDYIILLVTAGSLMAVHAHKLLPQEPAQRPPILVEAFDVSMRCFRVKLVTVA